MDDRDELRVVILGKPVGKGRPRISKRGSFSKMHTPTATANWEGVAAQRIHAAWAEREPLDVPVSVSIRAVAQRPKRLLRKKDPAHRIWRTSKPDADNVAKSALDALQAAGVVIDDSYVVDVRCLSLYAAKSEGPSVEIVVSLASDDPTL